MGFDELSDCVTIPKQFEGGVAAVSDVSWLTVRKPQVAPPEGGATCWKGTNCQASVDCRRRNCVTPNRPRPTARSPAPIPVVVLTPFEPVAGRPLGGVEAEATVTENVSVNVPQVAVPVNVPAVEGAVMVVVAVPVAPLDVAVAVAVPSVKLTVVPGGQPTTLTVALPPTGTLALATVASKVRPPYEASAAEPKPIARAAAVVAARMNFFMVVPFPR